MTVTIPSSDYTVYSDANPDAVVSKVTTMVTEFTPIGITPTVSFTTATRSPA